MKRHILFLKNVSLANALLATGKCENEGSWILTCDDNKEDIQILQNAATEFLKGTNYKDYELCFANPCNYSDFTTLSKTNSLSEEIKAKNILWKYDSELGIAYFCPKCKLFLCNHENECTCGQKIDWNNKIQYKGRVKWH